MTYPHISVPHPASYCYSEGQRAHRSHRSPRPPIASHPLRRVRSSSWRYPERLRPPLGSKIEAHTSGAPASSRVGQRSAIAREAHRAARRALAGALLARLQRLRPNSYVIGGGRRVLGRLGRRPAAAALLRGLSRHRVARTVSVAHRAKGQRRRKRARARQPARGNGERPSRVRARRHTPAIAWAGSAQSALGCASATVFEAVSTHQISA